jgi:hypothetical protein
MEYAMTIAFLASDAAIYVVGEMRPFFWVGANIQRKHRRQDRRRYQGPLASAPHLLNAKPAGIRRRRLVTAHAILDSFLRASWSSFLISVW